MNFWNVLADEATPAAGGSWITLIMLALVFVAFYFFGIRPQMKQEQEANNMRNSLTIGDEITTIGGIIGRVVKITDETVVIETTKDKTHIRFLRAAIRSVDVVAEDSHPIVHETPAEPAAKNGKKGKKNPAVEPAAMVETPAPETAEAAPAPEEVIEETPAPEATSVAPAPADNAEAAAADIAPETTADDETK